MSAPAPAAGAPEFRPHVFGKFFLLQRLATGGMAEIFRARITGAGGFEKELVLKRILPARSQDRQFIRMLVNEARLTVQLTHGNVAQIYECGAVEGVYFIAMELVHGASLKEVLRAFAAPSALEPEQAIYLVLQLLQGLSYAHRKVDGEGRPLQIVHCDVSPDNALVSWEGEVKLLDFGIARAATGLSNYREGMLMGKLGYVAPEQASLERAWDHRVDVFAAGVLLYELLTGSQPFPKATDPESLVASRRVRPPAPSSLDARIPRDLDAILARALAEDPDDRFADARAFCEALVDVLFPTPHSAIQESIAVKMKAAFAERIARERGARAHDALVMKVLQGGRGDGAALREAPPDPPLEPRPLAPEPTPVDLAPPRPVRGTSRRARRPPRAAWALVALAAAAAGAALALGIERRLATGSALVTSEPAGAEVALDGAPAGVTPLILERMRLARPHTLVLTAPGHRPATVILPAERRPVRTRHVRLEGALAPLRIESDPAGAEVRLDGLLLGRTPLTTPPVRIDERHRIDLALPGHELDQFVVLPRDAGTRFRRELEALPKAPPPARRTARDRGVSGR